MENDVDKELAIGVMAPVTMESGKKDSDMVKVFSFQKKKLCITCFLVFLTNLHLHHHKVC